jgi:hypothetical protein
MLSEGDCESPGSSLRHDISEEWSGRLKTTKGKIVGENFFESKEEKT